MEDSRLFESYAGGCIQDKLEHMIEFSLGLNSCLKVKPLEPIAFGVFVYSS